jgi:cytochrome b6-f complex iron-sulfur subunit
MTAALLIAFVAVAAVLAIAVFAVAWRRGSSGGAGAPTRREIRPGVDRDVFGTRASEVPEETVPVDPLEVRTEVSVEDYDVTRRQFFNRSIYGVFGLFLAQFGIAGLAFMWPRLRSGGFGSKVNAGPIDAIRSELFTPDGRVQPFFVPAAQAYVLPFQGEVAGSAYEGKEVVAEGLMALWQRCVHLGCRVPECASSQGFECPCHGSKYNYHGEYEDGPAPRNLDRFVVSVSDAGDFIIDTGRPVETPRATTKTAEYPQGPSCI